MFCQLAWAHQQKVIPDKLYPVPYARGLTIYICKSCLKAGLHKVIRFEKKSKSNYFSERLRGER
jgi:hypothetical protein